MVAVRRASRRSSLTVGVAAHLDLPDAFEWHFPKEFHAETTFDESKIYPQRAPYGGGAKGRVIDNRWITPYSPYLLLKYTAINVEVYKYYLILEVPVHSTVYRTGMLQKRPGDVGSFL
eukprot:CAMPEP_0118846914 /NCGR_PEP_ID=MMETSP1162-20130426/92704_1 /TAXON_ID=33656 /ORGANISM="Phaeocystis Sp, Strain CCMP2710" /LENGTH=117 /DNA_ID=CAMNT_0006779103 /DNA_START=18 /DNA_END=372 /DNA_ORIENTATION=+